MRLVRDLAPVLSVVVLLGGALSGRARAEAPTYPMELLELAYSGVSQMPLRPHIKNRSRAQLKVVEACLELDQPVAAEGYVANIANWQRWIGTAELAGYYAERGLVDQSKKQIAKVEAPLRMAEEIRAGKVAASTPNPLIDTLADWRYEAVLTRVEEVRRLNGTVGAAAAEELYGEVNAAELNVARTVDVQGDAAKAIAALQPYVSHPNFEIIHHGLLKMAEVAAAHYAEMDVPALVENDVEPRMRKVPVFLRIDVYARFADAAIENNDAAAAGVLIHKLQDLVDGLAPRPRYHIPEAAKVVRLRLKLGQTQEARDQIESLWGTYQEKEELIISIDRAELLCEMAELHHLSGGTAKALELYRKAVDAGLVNPNSRPRADDLNTICCSMALAGVEPSADLWKALREMRGALGAPW